MASFLDKFKVKTALENNTKLDLGCQHITTADFFTLSPIYMKEMVPGEKININIQSFTRLAPLGVPTFGRINMHNRVFFVPFRTIFKGWNDFITDTTHVYSGQNTDVSNIGSKVPTFKLGDLTQVFYDSRWSQVASSTDSYDFVYRFGSDESGATTYYRKFTYAGRQLYKILLSLGYNIVPQFVINGNEWNNYEVSALPLLAFAKIYCDWYFPSAYYDSVERTNIEKYFVLDNSASGTILSIADLKRICNRLWMVSYDSDYFVSAFDNPVGSTSGSWSSVNIPDVTVDGFNSAVGSGVWVRPSSVGSGYPNNGTPVLNGSGVSISNLSQYAIDALKKLTDYMKRHQLVGARAMDRYLARFGKNLTAEKLNRSNYIGAQNVPIQIGDVMSNASTEGAILGDYAGKGVGFNGQGFEFETDEYGIFMVCSSIVPTVGYYQGLDRTVMHKSKLDFWTPEFDQLGNQAIASSELMLADLDNDDTYSTEQPSTTQVFGWTPRYSEYKVGRDRLTGDWRIPSLSVSGDVSDSWHLMRKIVVPQASELVHSRGFVSGEQDYQQYDRIFSNTQDSADHFYVIHNFDVVSYSPMASLYDTYEFDSKGKDVVEDVNGVKVN